MKLLQFQRTTKDKNKAALCQNRVNKVEEGLEVATRELAKIFVSHVSLQDDSSIRSEIKTRETALKRQLDKISLLEQQLGNYTAIVAQNTAALEGLKTELSMVRISGEFDLAAAQRKKRAKSSVIPSGRSAS